MSRAKRAARLRNAYRSLSDSKWKIADVLLEEFPANAFELHSNEAVRELGKFAEEARVDLSGKTLATYRHMAIAWPPEMRRDASFTVHRILIHNPARFEIIEDGMSVSRAEAMHDHKPRPQRKSPASLAAALEMITAGTGFVRSAIRVIPATGGEELKEALEEGVAALRAEMGDLDRAIRNIRPR